MSARKAFQMFHTFDEYQLRNANAARGLDPACIVNPCYDRCNASRSPSSIDSNFELDALRFPHNTDHTAIATSTHCGAAGDAKVVTAFDSAFAAFVSEGTAKIGGRAGQLRQCSVVVAARRALVTDDIHQRRRRFHSADRINCRDGIIDMNQIQPFIRK